MWVDIPTFMCIQGSVTLGRRATGTQGHKYIDIIGNWHTLFKRFPASDRHLGVTGMRRDLEMEF